MPYVLIIQLANEIYTNVYFHIQTWVSVGKNMYFGLKASNQKLDLNKYVEKCKIELNYLLTYVDIMLISNPKQPYRHVKRLWETFHFSPDVT